MNKAWKIIFGIFILGIVSCVSFFLGRYIEEQKYMKIIEEQPPYIAPTFYATIDKIDDNWLLVTGLEINDINHRGQYVFEVAEDTLVKWNNSDISVDELQVGNVISVAYSGGIMETSPGEIEKVMKIDLLEEQLILPEVDPWIDDISLSEAQELAGFRLELPEVIADSYVAVRYRAIENEVIEVTYADEEYEIIIKRAIGENKNYIDNSVSYTEVSAEQYHTNMATYDITYFRNEGKESHTLVTGNGYSWTIYAPNGYWGDSAMDFIHEICR